MADNSHSGTPDRREDGSSLPEGWCQSTIGELAEVNPKKIDADLGSKAGFVPMALAPVNFLDSLEHEEKTWGEIKKSYTNFQDNDVIFAKVTPCFENGKAAIVRNLPNAIGAGSSEFYVLRAHKSLVSEKLIFAVVKTFDFLQQGAENMTGAVGLRRVPRAFVEAFPVPLPPLAEQKVIAEKLDTLLAQVDTTKARLERIPDIIKRFRQSVLSAAVSGKLTEGWVVDRLILSDVADFQNGYAFKSGWFESEGEYQVIKLGNIRDGYLAIENSPAYLKPDVAKDYIRFSPEPGDTLISMTGTRFKKDYGFGCLVRDEKKILINQRVGRLTPKKSFIMDEYLNLFVRSDRFRDQFFKGETGGVNQGNVGSNHIMSISVELPGIEKQTEIVRRVEELFAYADTIEQKAAAALERVNNLTQSILAKAFRGELTADWRAANPALISGDNSAEALLAKIQAEREKLALEKKAAKKPRKKKTDAATATKQTR